MISDDPYTHF